MHPRRHPQLRVRFEGQGQPILECAPLGVEVDVSPQVVELVARCDGSLSLVELAAAMPWTSAMSPAAGAVVVQHTLSHLQAKGLLLAAGQEPEEYQGAYFENYDWPSVHRFFVGDRVRTEAYRRAIEELVRPGDTVIDVGTGTGILAMFAARAGAGTVHAIEPTPRMFEQAQLAAKRNGLAERITFHRGDALEVELDVEADLVIGDWIGNFVVQERIFPALAAQRDRCLKPEGRMFPASVELFLAPVCDPEARAQGPAFWGSRPYDLDMGPLEELEYQRLGSETRYVTPEQLLAQPIGLRTFDAKTLQPGELLRFACPEVTFELERDGHLDGLCGFFVARLSPNEVLDTGPSAPATFYRQQFFPVRAVPVKRGDTLAVTVEAFTQAVSLKGRLGEAEFAYTYDEA